MTYVRKTAIAGLLLVLPFASYAGKADVENVVVTKNSVGNYNFSVTVRHKDEGWNHYANQWQVLGNDGKVYATRILYHPHVEEQPFTRSLNGVQIPSGLKQVIVRARDSKHGYGGKSITVRLP